MDLLKDTLEWKDTRIVFEIVYGKVTMSHMGLRPELECFNDCTNGWNFYLKESLYNYIQGRRGLPGNGIRATINAGGETWKGMVYSKDQPVPMVDGIILDVEEMKVECVVSIYSAHVISKEVDVNTFKGKYYMLLEKGAAPPLQAFTPASPHAR